jgi:hypothetical protein
MILVDAKRAEDKVVCVCVLMTMDLAGVRLDQLLRRH